jgi:hypothetical protein
MAGYSQRSETPGAGAPTPEASNQRRAGGCLAAGLTPRKVGGLVAEGQTGMVIHAI